MGHCSYARGDGGSEPVAYRQADGTYKIPVRHTKHFPSFRLTLLPFRLDPHSDIPLEKQANILVLHGYFLDPRYVFISMASINQLLIAVVMEPMLIAIVPLPQVIGDLRCFPLFRKLCVCGDSSLSSKPDPAQCFRCRCFRLGAFFMSAN